ncbi:sporulation sigma-E factor-processing peptidase SpoIIGA [Gottschalkia acidurici 9a]|uniref:Sporulation sigma-E factor-processing peptidase n=1 Tax=Gottschalkia acidurici (strain ATCC 7906 / DSM 604 / BCRC 14475 / CIP 104303 / KCTC 5404 / NCIMB 10678 / 9a) TaxID=1128398 RepID=K0AYI2_GOTA9|nr:sigma-E processing peptidase SpoIIGA [Gottschalkia acidurici]AFS78319.1 sporulation sigma-E factor-processing peptidase SpoIIGA [Gottschalkia acidurici 9a]
MYVYAEYLLLENLIINYIILYSTKIFTKTCTSRRRIFLASLIGSVYTLVVFFPSVRLMAKITTKVIVAVIIIKVAFKPKNLRNFIKLIATFHLVAFTFAGACLALFYMMDVNTYIDGGIFYISNFKIKTLILGILFGWILFQLVLEYLQSRSIKSKSFIPIIVNFKDKEVNIRGLLDTGNSLKEPMTKTPVIVVQFSAIKEILPEYVQNIFCKYSENDLDLITNVLYNASNKIKFRLIPYKSLGKEDGMLLGFKPDKVILDDKEDRQIKDVVIGIYNGRLSNDNEYKALIHPDILT